MSIIKVASKNPVKIQSVKEAFKTLFSERTCQIEGVSIPSLVSDQPMGNKETFQGALNRAKGAQEKHPEADFCVGIEGGNIMHGEDMEVMAWIVVVAKRHVGKARTAGFFLPPPIIELIHKGYELGHADDIVFGVDNSKQGSGACGLLTDGAIDRLNLYKPAVIMAFIPFLKPDLYN